MNWKMLAAFVAILSFLLVLVPKQSEASAPTCYSPNQPKRNYINVSVSTLWKVPGTKRTIDKYSLSNPVDMRKWTASMPSANTRKWLTGKTETQALYGQEVQILKTSGRWLQIAVKDQYTAKNKYGYPGWVPKSHVTKQQAGYNNCRKAIVKTKTADLYDDKNKKYMEISFNARLFVTKTEKDWIKVITPSSQTKWLKRSDVKIYAASTKIPKPSGSNLVNTAKMFLGLPYLWAGTSAYGFDCSGFTHSVYKYHGITIPRDASEQIKKGKSVSKNQLHPGDLLFFAYNNGKGRVHHVSMYAGNGKMIHAPRAGKKIEIISINTEPYKQEFAGARRFAY
ncbi:C40 family peptidase [Peribacillus glennii]|nr:C40 family peptidase [Peribacillus glennii]